MDFRSAFSSVDRKALWLLSKYCGIPQKLIDLIQDLYTNTVSCVQADSVYSPTGFRSLQGYVRVATCNIAPNLFLEPMDWIMDKTIHRGFAGISVDIETFIDLHFAR